MVWPSYIQSAINTQEASRKVASESNVNADANSPYSSLPVAPSVTPSGPTVADRIVDQPTPFESSIWNGPAPLLQTTAQSDTEPAVGLLDPSDRKFYVNSPEALARWDAQYAEQIADVGISGVDDIGNVDNIGSVDNSSAVDGPVLGLTDDDFQAAADRLGVDVASVKAIAEVESRGSGFLDSGDPAILFEAHAFSRATGGIHNDSHPNISSPRWDRSLYGASGQHQHDRLNEAAALNETAALESASWGAFQIMGFNHEAAGYDNVQDFVAAMRESESNHLDAFVGFIESHPRMVTALRNRDWASFASQYNGPGYAQNNYDTKMAEAYARHSN